MRNKFKLDDSIKRVLAPGNVFHILHTGDGNPVICGVMQEAGMRKSIPVKVYTCLSCGATVGGNEDEKLYYSV